MLRCHGKPHKNSGKIAKTMAFLFFRKIQIYEFGVHFFETAFIKGNLTCPDINWSNEYRKPQRVKITIFLRLIYSIDVNALTYD